MKKIEKLIEKAKGKRIALVVPEELIDTVEKYFDDDNLYDFTRGEVTLSIFGIDFDIKIRKFSHLSSEMIFGKSFNPALFQTKLSWR